MLGRLKFNQIDNIKGIVEQTRTILFCILLKVSQYLFHAYFKNKIIFIWYFQQDRNCFKILQTLSQSSDYCTICLKGYFTDYLDDEFQFH